MFLFLSKLLPLFFYPLGLATLLLGLIAVWSWKQRSWLQGPALVGFVVLYFGGNVWVSDALLGSLEYGVLAPEPIPSAEAAVVLGGAVYGSNDSQRVPEVNEAGDRLIYAAQLYQQGKIPRLLLTGGRIPWLGGGRSEAEDMATLLQLFGIPKTALLLEPQALNTYENALFSKKILQEQQIKTFLLITSAFHMPRAKLIFEKLGLTVIPTPTDFRTPSLKANPPLGAMLLGLFPDAKYLENTTLALKEYLGLGIYKLRGWL
ncbi:YdcF family protein [Synechocystis sp. LKSZ1]|uniref:YdcF family protein n=1 Tax=Synechocystis sp. LKSZ1 TaxID=3144951 RepID=UPI00336BB355